MPDGPEIAVDAEEIAALSAAELTGAFMRDTGP